MTRSSEVRRRLPARWPLLLAMVPHLWLSCVDLNEIVEPVIPLQDYWGSSDPSLWIRVRHSSAGTRRWVLDLDKYDRNVDDVAGVKAELLLRSGFELDEVPSPLNETNSEMWVQVSDCNGNHTLQGTAACFRRLTLIRPSFDHADTTEDLISTYTDVILIEVPDSLLQNPRRVLWQMRVIDGDDVMTVPSTPYGHIIEEHLIPE